MKINENTVWGAGIFLVVFYLTLRGWQEALYVSFGINFWTASFPLIVVSCTFMFTAILSGFIDGYKKTKAYKESLKNLGATIEDGKDKEP